MGSAGVVAYSMNGQRLWDGSNFGIIDCYALNVVNSNEVYFYYYDDSFLVLLNEIEESIRYRLEGNTLQQFMFDKSGLIGQVDSNTLKRLQIKNRTITSKEKIKLKNHYGDRINGPVLMRGKFLNAFGKDEIYKNL
ncbi:hypothetical protein [Cytobacillus purgationiresistens]|uniref:Uncharacterized protein n=1 Tax=Cytobacillus purgationiresistens TaxID=863449 RepID=A0ABU0ACF0_9BACI|nr:hypothetical protein [Cytobacillus purgationiresistens]MDQ0268477.1 hypothetical protein [Cytobacillus purgationiresistens]